MRPNIVILCYWPNKWLDLFHILLNIWGKDDLYLFRWSIWICRCQPIFKPICFTNSQFTICWIDHNANSCKLVKTIHNIWRCSSKCWEKIPAKSIDTLIVSEWLKEISITSFVNIRRLCYLHEETFLHEWIKHVEMPHSF